MKKMVMLIILGAICALGFSTATASAGANCAIQLNNIYWDGQFASDVNAYACTQVNGFRLRGYEYPGATGITWYQGSGGRDFATSTPTLTTTYANPQSSFGWFTFHVPFFGGGCGAPAMTVRSHFQWQIRNSVGNTWGAIRQVTSGNQFIC